jgi:hypothetical protein
MMLDLFRVENGRPVRAPEDALRPDFFLGSCPAGTTLIEQPVPPDGSGNPAVGRWATGLRLGTTPGECYLKAEIQEYQGGSWEPSLMTGSSASVWAVEMEIVTPLPPVLVEMGGRVDGRFPAKYRLEPTDYVPDRLAIQFLGDGKVTAITSCAGRGNGELGFRFEGVEMDVSKSHSIRSVINPGWGPANPGAGGWTLEMTFPQYPLELFRFGLEGLWDTRNIANRIFNPTRKDDPAHDEGPDINGDTYGVPRNYLYVVADAENTYSVSLKLNADSPGFCQQGRVAIFHNDEKIPGTDMAIPENCSEEIPLTLTDPFEDDATTNFLIKVGLDSDESHTLDPGEMQARLGVFRKPGDDLPQFAAIRGINKGKYEWHREELEDKLTAFGTENPPPRWPAPYARSFLYMFVDGDINHVQPDIKPDEEYERQFDAYHQATPDDSIFSEWLTHTAGANFDENGRAWIQHRYWRFNSRVARFFEQRTPFALTTTIQRVITTSQGDQVTVIEVLQTSTGAELERFYESVVRPEAEAALAGQPSGMIVELPIEEDFYRFPREGSSLFKSQSPDWVPEATVDVGSSGGHGDPWVPLFSQYIGGTDSFHDYDAAGTIGRGRVLDPRYRFVVMKTGDGGFRVERVLFRCKLQDLYDFNYESGILPSHAAAVQLAHQPNSSGKVEGWIFFDEIEINTEYLVPFGDDVIR